MDCLDRLFFNNLLKNTGLSNKMPPRKGAALSFCR